MLRLADILKQYPLPEEDQHPGLQHVLVVRKGHLPELMTLVGLHGGSAVVPPRELNATNFYLTIRIPYGRSKDFLSLVREERVYRVIE